MGAVDAVTRAAGVLGDRGRPGEPLGPRTTFRVGGPAALFIEVDADQDLALVSRAVTAGLPVLVVGRGSNLLVADAGFAGLAVSLGEAHATLELDGTTVRAGGAVPLPVLARLTATAGLSGLEWAVGVPGSLGGGVRMNAGGHGSVLGASLLRVGLIDLATGDAEVVDAGDLALGYRRSVLTPTQLVLWAELGLARGDVDATQAAVTEVVRWRRAHQPGGQNAGSVFTNPPGDSAGRLVEAAGCKGMRRGTAQVSDKHANFIQADVGGSAADVAALMAAVANQVRRATGITLRPEVHMVGFTKAEVQL